MEQRIIKSGIELIAAERKRQVEKEGWSAEHDATHTGSELAFAAAAYCTHPVPIYTKSSDDFIHISFSPVWPFEEKIDDEKTELRKLVIAGALIAAEIDRLQSPELLKP